MNKKLIAAIAVGVIVLLSGVVAIAQYGADTDMIPTSIPGQPGGPGSGDWVSQGIGGIFYSGIAVDGNEDENQLLIEEYSAQTAVPMQVQNASGTPVFQVEPDGGIDSEGALDSASYLKLGVGTPVVVTTPAAGDFIASDDVEIVDDLHVEGAVKVGLATPVGITWDDDDIGVNDDAWIGDDAFVGGSVSIGQPTPAVITFDDDDLVVADDAEVLGTAALGDAVVASKLVATSRAAIDLATDFTLTSTGTFQEITVNGSSTITSSATTAIADGTYDGQLLIIWNNDDQDVVIQDGANTTFSGDMTLTASAEDILAVIWDATGSSWVGLFQTDN